jgi:hypothetical protein
VAAARARPALLSKPLEPPVLDPALRRRLEAMYRDEVAGLREATGLPLATWSL